MRKLFWLTLLLLLTEGPNLFAQCISSYPFIEDFENSQGNWTTSGINTDWAWGTPSKAVITSAGSGVKCWISGGLTGSLYGGNQKSSVQSPCFDFTTLQNPYLTFLIFWDTERQYDGGNLQYSLNNGVSWVNVGNSNQAQDCLEKNWFNTNSITNLSGLASPQQGWSGTIQSSSGSCLGGSGSGAWKEAGICLGYLAGEPNVLFRFTFCSGSTCNAFDGIAIDLFTIREAPVPQPTAGFVCNGGYSVSFNGTSTLCPQQWKWYFGDPSTLADSAATQNAQYTYPGPGIYTVTLNAAHSCSAKGTTTIQVKFPVVTVTTDSVQCAGANDGAAQAVATGVTNPVYLWGTNPVTQSSTVNGLAAGNYSLSVSSADGCVLDTIIEIGLGPGSTPQPVLEPTHIICVGESVLLYPGSFVDYLWQDGSTDSVFLATDVGEYTVTVSNTTGCTGSASSNVLFSCGDNVWIPSAFTPGEDGLNDLFLASATAFEEGTLRIFNRWGQPVFTGDYTQGWDGNYDGKPSPEGIYYYRFRYRLPGDKYREKAGWLTLLR